MSFSGRAVYSNFAAIAEDVSDLVALISPSETPLLDAIGDAPFPAKNVLHEWLEDSLCPNTIVATVTTTSDVTTDTFLSVTDSSGASVTSRLRVGMILRNQTGGEYMSITAVGADTIGVKRAFGATAVKAVTAGNVIDVISDAALEGDDADTDTSAVRSRKNNYVQIFKKDVIVSGTQQAVTQLAGVSDEFNYQQEKRMRELLRDLEKAAILGILSTNTIGTASGRRTFQGIRAFLPQTISGVTASNAQSVGATLTESWLGNSIKAAWDAGGTDIDVIVAGVNYKRIIDTFNASRKLIPNETQRFANVVSEYESTFGLLKVILSRWMPPSEALILSTKRVKVLPLQGRSFQFKEVASQGDSRKGFIVGEYTIEMRNSEGMSRIY